jgi:hypothetical protein
VECINLDRILVGKRFGTGIQSCLVLDFGFGLSLIEYVYSGTTDLVRLGEEVHVFKKKKGQPTKYQFYSASQKVALFYI